MHVTSLNALLRILHVNPKVASTTEIHNVVYKMAIVTKAKPSPRARFSIQPVGTIDLSCMKPLTPTRLNPLVTQLCVSLGLLRESVLAIIAWGTLKVGGQPKCYWGQDCTKDDHHQSYESE